MPLPRCTFVLNNRPVSTLTGGPIALSAFSGTTPYVNNPDATAIAKAGPLPVGMYYIVDRRSGGILGWLRDPIEDALSRSNRSVWFALYRNDRKIDDWTFINGVKRGNFRLHPAGRFAISEGCITIGSENGFDRLRAYLLSNKPQKIPGTTIDYYGTVEVK